MSKVDGKTTRRESLGYKIKAKVEKRATKDGPVLETVESEGNLTTTTGKQRRGDLLIGTSVGLSAAAVRLGIGDSATVADPADTSLGANEFYQVMNATYPQSAAGVITFQAEYDATEANFTWASWGLDVDDSETATAGATALDLFNRKVFAFGTKDGGVWTLTVTLTLS